MSIVRSLVPLSLALLAACAQQPQRDVELDAGSDCPVRLQVGQTLTLMLPSNPSTGYRWQPGKLTSGALRSLGPEVYSDPEHVGIVGSAGQSTWRFQAMAVGEERLLLVYQQPWAPEVEPVQRFDCHVQVR